MQGVQILDCPQSGEREAVSIHSVPTQTIRSCGSHWCVFSEVSLDSLSKCIAIGPNELSFCDREAVNPILGSRGLLKGPCKSPSSPLP